MEVGNSCLCEKVNIQGSLLFKDYNDENTVFMELGNMETGHNYFIIEANGTRPNNQERHFP